MAELTGASTFLIREMGFVSLGLWEVFSTASGSGQGVSAEAGNQPSRLSVTLMMDSLHGGPRNFGTADHGILDFYSRF